METVNEEDKFIHNFARPTELLIEFGKYVLDFPEHQIQK